MLNSLRTSWNSLSPLQKGGLAAILVAVFGGILALAITSSRPSYGVLFSKLTPQDAGAIKKKLQAQNISFKVENDNEILVPSDQVHEIRMDLASENLPANHGELGYELLDKPNLGMTESALRMNQKRSLEGELTRTIKSQDGIEEARVHIALPEKPLFSDPSATSEVTASVSLRLKDGYRLSEKQVDGIAHLVSFAVERLKPENVSIIDSKNNQLNAKGEGESIGMDQAQQQERLERRLTQELQQLADRTLGDNRAEISVRAELDWDQSQIAEEKYKPSGVNGANLPTNESKTDERYTRADAAAPSAPGTMTNTVANNNNNPGNYNRSQDTNTYVVDKTTTRRVMATGKPKKLSVAVFLDEAANIPPAKQIDLRNTLATAAGLDLTSPASGGRGDQISLTIIPFDRTEEKNAEAKLLAAANQDKQMAMIRNGAALLTLVLVAVFTLIMMRPRRPKRQKLDATVGDKKNAALGSKAGDAPGLPSGGTPSTDGSVPNEGSENPLGEIPLDEEELATPLGRIRRIAVTQPEDVAAMLQDWLREQPTTIHR